MTSRPHRDRLPPRSRETLNFFSRREIKYALDGEYATRLRHLVGEKLPCYEFNPGHPYTYITTVYFDTERLDFYQRARVSYDDNLKIRVKEYYYRDSGRVITFPCCYVEIKQRVQGLVMKRRIRLPKDLLNRFMAGGEVWKELVQKDPGVEFEDIEEIYSELRRYLRTYPVRPRSIIHYRRTVHQQDEKELRITFDDQLEVFKPVPGLFDTVDSLQRENLGVPERKLRRFLLEVKCLREYPEWLRECLSDVLPRKISKFTTSIKVLSRNGELHEDSSTGPQGILQPGADKLDLVEGAAIGNIEDTQERGIRP